MKKKENDRPPPWDLGHNDRRLLRSLRIAAVCDHVFVIHKTSGVASARCVVCGETIPVDPPMKETP